MFFVDDLKRWRKRRRRIRELEQATTDAMMRTYDPDPILDASLLIDLTRKDRFELDGLQRAPLIRAAKRWGLDIPGEYWDNEGLRHEGCMLSEEDKNWIRRELAKCRRERAKEWVAIISPILSAIIAILGLLVAFKKR